MIPGSEVLKLEGDGVPQRLLAFSDDSRTFLFATRKGIQTVALPEPDIAAPSSPAEPKLLEGGIRDPQSLAVFSDPESGRLQQLGLLGTAGDVEWWDVSGGEPVRHDLPNVFAAYADRMKVFGLEPEEVRTDLRFGLGGRTLLVSCAETFGEFGIAAVQPLDAEAAEALSLEQGTWYRLLHRYQGKYLASTTRAQGDAGGVVSGFRLTDVSELGASAAMWMGDDGVLSVGFDGMLVFWNLLAQASMLVTDGVSTADFSNYGHGLWAGTRSGALRQIDTDHENAPPRVLNGHDAAVREILQVPGSPRLVSIDAAGVGRVWRLDHPVLTTDEVRDVSADLRWLITDAGERGGWLLWDLDSADPFATPAAPGVLADIAACAFAPDSPWLATLAAEAERPGRVVVRLWSLTAEPPFRAPHTERRFTFDDLGEYWHWQSMELFVGGGEARLLLSGGSIGERRTWIVDLWRPDRPPTPLAPDKGSSAPAADPQLRWLARETAAPSRDTAAPVEIVDLRHPGGPVVVRTVPAPPHPSYGGPSFSADGRWLVQGSQLFDLRGTPDGDGATRWIDLSDGHALALGRDRPPLWIDGDGDLRIWAGSAGAGRPAEAVAGRGLAAAAWDETGGWLGVGDDAGRVWLHAAPASAGPSELRQRVLAALGSAPLPPPLEPLTPSAIYRLELFPGAGWVVAETDDDHFLLWPRKAGGGWDSPLVFQQEELFLGGSGVRVSVDGRRMLLEGQLLELDPARLQREAARLRSGRIE